MRPLLHIGYHKTGTTYLQKRVFNSAQSGFSRIGEPLALRAAFVEPKTSTFDPEQARGRFEAEVEEAIQEDLTPVFSLERFSGRPAVGGQDSRVLADRLHATFPNARVLIVIREQVDMIVSVYKMIIKRGGAQSLPQFVNPPSGVESIPHFRFDFHEYHHLIEYYREAFGAENVLVLPYELLQSRPKKFIDRVVDFTDAQGTLKLPQRRMNVSPSSFSLALKRRANRFFVKNAFNPDPILGVPGANTLLRRMSYYLDSVVPGSTLLRHEKRLREQAEREVGRRYARSNTITAELTGLDLRRFGYSCEEH